VLKPRPLDLDDPADCARWDRFCATSADAWFWHTSDWLRYQRAYRPDLSSRNRSFFLEDGDAVVALCPLLEETSRAGDVELGAGGSAAPAPAFASGLDGVRRRDVARALFDAIDALVRQCGAGRVSFRDSPLSASFARRVSAGNPFVEHGYLDVSLRTQVIALEATEDELWSAIRKGHRSDIRRAERERQVEVYDKATLSRTAFAEYRALHAKAAGRVTRPELTFELMHEWIRRGDALLIGVRDRDVLVSVALIIVYSAAAYYASGANDPATETPGAAHLVQWRALRELKARGVRRYEIGWQQQIAVPHDVPTPKQRSISFFKHGFGGTTVPLFAGEKYYSARFYGEVAAARTAAYVAELETRRSR
jgi:hypothetical protein